MAELNLDSLNEVTGGRSLNSEDRASYLSLMSHFDEVATRLASSGRRADVLAMSGEIEARIQEWMEKGIEVRDIVSLRTHFSLPPLIEYKKNGKLVEFNFS